MPKQTGGADALLVPVLYPTLARVHWGKMNWANATYLSTVYPHFDDFNVGPTCGAWNG